MRFPSLLHCHLEASPMLFAPSICLNPFRVTQPPEYKPRNPFPGHLRHCTYLSPLSWSKGSFGTGLGSVPAPAVQRDAANGLPSPMAPFTSAQGTPVLGKAVSLLSLGKALLAITSVGNPGRQRSGGYSHRSLSFRLPP